jgi:hypothetical protein
MAKYKEVPNHTWWKGANNKKTYYIGDVGFGFVWLVEVYKNTAIKQKVEHVLLQMNEGNLIQYNEDGSLQS